MQFIVKQVARTLSAWREEIKPIRKGDWIVLSGLDRSNIGKQIDDLFFYPAVDGISGSRWQNEPMQAFDVLDTGSLRNSFYPEIFIRHSRVTKTALSITLTGSASLQVFFSQQSQSATLIAESELAPPVDHEAGTPYEVSIPISLHKGLPENSRLHWRLRCLEDDMEIPEANWTARAPAHTNGMMLVALRTFGRTQDIVELLESFQEEADHSGSPRYRHLLRNTFFIILDTSPDVESEDFAPLKACADLNYHAISGANLGGGGNMSQIMRVFAEACAEANVQPDELLLLDDDLNLSLESLYRHWASTLFRSDNTVFTLPVLTKTEPRRMWEDGAFWGRFLGGSLQGMRTHLAPRLLRHNIIFRGSNHLDLMATRNYPEYCTFIFFSLPWTLFEKLGYPLAIFLRGDDIEYSLRANKLGGAKIMSNPNIAAWHEPAHSYGQEYMSIAHGMLINMAYGQNTGDELIRFFHHQALRHLSLHDISGLVLYAEVLRDFLARDQFLENGFAGHYVAKLKFFKTMDSDFEHIPDEIVESLRRGHSGSGKKLAEHSFMYMDVEGREDVGTVMLFNPHTRMYRTYRYDDVQIMEGAARAASDLFTLIARFGGEFADLRAHYLDKIQACRSAAYWDAELALREPAVDLGHSRDRDRVAV